MNVNFLMKKLRELFWVDSGYLVSYCEESNIAPIWEMYSSEFKVIWDFRKMSTGERSRNNQYGDIRTSIYETENNSMKNIQFTAFYILAVNCGLVCLWFGHYKGPILNDFQTNHGAKNANGERNGRPRNKFFGITFFGSDKCIGFKRFIIAGLFLINSLIPFFDSIKGK